MADPYRDEPGASSPTDAQIREAFGVWSRSVLGAPRRLDRQITSVEAHDEVVVRIATEIARRTLFERRQPAHARARRAGQRLDPNAIDPFGESIEELRARSEHAEPCGRCAGGGLIPCPECRATGSARCGECGGSGRTYARSSRGAKCKGCRETGKVRCPACDGGTKVTCPACSGSGQELVWWEYVEEVHTVVSIPTETPILAAHRQLREQRFLSARDLQAFTPFVTVQHAGPIPHGELAADDERLLSSAGPPIDPRLERVRAQQFLSFGAVRRDVCYEMCGAAGTVTLSGANLLGARTRKALGPITRRLMFVAVAAVALVVIAKIWHGAFAGSAAYFAVSNGRMTWVLLLGFAGALVAVAGVLRAWRPGGRWWPIGKTEKAAAAVFVAAVASCPLIAYASRPRLQDARAAVAAGELERAELIVDALKANGKAADGAAGSDDIAIAEADRLAGDARIAKLDLVATGHGPRAAEARSLATRARLDAVRGMLAGGQSTEALARLDTWPAELAAVPEAVDLRADGLDQAAHRCADAACRFVAARAANTARPTPARGQALEASRQQAFSELAPPDAAAPDLAKRLHALRGAAKIAGSILAATPDAEIEQKAKFAVATAQSEFAKVVLIGAPVAVVDEVLERPTDSRSLTGWQDLDGVAAYVSDSGGRCVGIYVVGASAAGRSLVGKEAGLRRLLAQATGSAAASIHARPKSEALHATSRWAEGATPVMARWAGEVLMELRIGNATP